MKLWSRRRGYHLVVLAVLITIAAAVAVRGALQNQTATMTKIEGATFQTLGPAPSTTATTVSLNSSRWNVTTTNADLSNQNSGLSVSSSLHYSGYPAFVVSETLGLSIDVSTNPYLYLDVNCDAGSQWTASIGWPGWTSASGPNIVAKLSQYPFLLGGVETTHGLIWLKANYPSSPNSCDGRSHWLRVDVQDQFSRYNLSNPLILGGVQVEQIIQSDVTGHPLRVTSVLMESAPTLYSLTPSQGVSTPLSDGTAAFVSHSLQEGLRKGLFPKRAYVQYKIDAPTTTEYALFGAFKGKGQISLIRVPFVFRHSGTNSDSGTFIDFLSPATPDYNLEPVASLQTLIGDGDFAIMFTPLGGTGISNVHLEFVQIYWSKLAFNDLATVFSLPVPQGSILVSGSVGLIVVAVVIPSAVMLILIRLWYKKSLPSSLKSFWAMLLLGCILRLVIAPISSSIDTENFASVASIYYSTGAVASEWVSLPGFVYIQTLAYLPYALLRQAGFTDFQYLFQPLFAVEDLTVKLPAILADLGTAYLIFKLAKEFRPDMAVLVPSLYLLNPLTISVSGVYGQFDGIFVLLALVALYYAVVRRKSIRGGVLLGYAALVNPVGLAAWIPISLSNLRDRDLRNFLVIVATAGLVVLVGLVPIFLEASSPILVTSSERFLHAIPGEAVVEGTFHFSAYGVTYLSSIGYGLTYRFFLEVLGMAALPGVYPIGAAVSVLALTALLVFKVRRTGQSVSRLPDAYLYFLGIASLFQLTYPTIFPQFSIWIVATLFVTYITTNSKPFLIIALFLSILVGDVYVLGVDNPVGKATGASSSAVLRADPGFVNGIWSGIGLAYSAALIVILVLIVHRWIFGLNWEANSSIVEEQ